MSHSGADRYTEMQLLGHGSFGRVFLARDNLTGEKVAVKKIVRGPNIDKRVMNQILNHRLLNHPHIIEFKECFLTKEHLCIVMEYAPGGNLKTFITRRGVINETTCRWFFQQLIIGLEYCHNKGVIHRDITLENVLVEGNADYPLLKISDFTFSKHEYLNSASHSSVGTPVYIAPEMFLSKGGQIYDGQKVDIWSCGVLLYAMLFNCYPFVKKEDLTARKSTEKFFQRVLNSPLEFPINDVSLRDAQDFLTKILEKDPDRRITLHQIMEHKWFRTNLPDGALEMNKGLNQLDHGLQSEDEIRTIVQAAMKKNSNEDETAIVLHHTVSDDSDSL